MQFDYFSSTEENKKKWLQSIIIGIIVLLVVHLGEKFRLNATIANAAIILLLVFRLILSII